MIPLEADDALLTTFQSPLSGEKDDESTVVKCTLWKSVANTARTCCHEMTGMKMNKILYSNMVNRNLFIKCYMANNQRLKKSATLKAFSNSERTWSTPQW